jgi:hypothetical protein
MPTSRSIFFAALVAGCAPDPATQGGLTVTVHPDRFLDYNEFVCHVQPVLIKRCSYLACHGQADHAFRVYSLGKLRLGGATTRSERSTVPLSTDEVERNFESASGVLYGASADDRQRINVQTLPLLSRPLAARFGGDEHQGVAVFPTWPNPTPDTDQEFIYLLNWVAGAGQPNPVDPDCAALFNAMGLSPRSPS